MRRLPYVINFIISGAVLWVSSKLFPEQIRIKDFGTLVIATVLLWLTTLVIRVIGLICMGSGAVFRSCSWIILGGLILIGAKILALYILSKNLPGFSIEGFWPMIFIALACSLFSFSVPSDSNRNKPSSNYYYNNDEYNNNHDDTNYFPPNDYR